MGEVEVRGVAACELGQGLLDQGEDAGGLVPGCGEVKGGAEVEVEVVDGGEVAGVGWVAGLVGRRRVGAGEDLGDSDGLGGAGVDRVGA